MLEVLKCFVRRGQNFFYLPMLFTFMAGGERGVRGFKMFCQTGSEFFLLALCVCGGGGGVRFSTSPSVK